METRIGGERARENTNKLPFDEAIHMDTIGLVGGLWILWNSDRVQITQLAMLEQKIHVLVKVLISNFEFICTTVYASPRFHERCILWNNLKNAANLHDKPWIIAGDFNKVLAEGDKFGGRYISSNRSLLFKECVDHCNIIDLGFVGTRFTWTNRRNINALVQERIDWFFANLRWYAFHRDAKEELWVQKSYVSRLIEGDQNTAFHHMSTIVRRRHNKISCIKNDTGEWIQSKDGAMNYIRRGFEKLFKTSLNHAPLNPIRPSRWLASLSNEERSNMSTMVTDAKIKDGPWALKACKAPGPNGLHAGFFQRFWLIVDDLVKTKVKKAFKECKLPKYLNRTNVVLIPKIVGLESL
ncbi:uncharacterized protein LOC142625236 [Castanea sativa]|uniref:uncharacterized protein LOC142625236 n=1 Tax=Castanea sativa TaxID=21020 RepID=UPI003F64E174